MPVRPQIEEWRTEGRRVEPGGNGEGQRGSSRISRGGLCVDWKQIALERVSDTPSIRCSPKSRHPR
jgi:hypothetical protein